MSKETIWKGKKPISHEGLLMLVVLMIFLLVIFVLLLPVLGFGVIQEMRENSEFYAIGNASGDSMYPIIEDQDMLIVQLKTHPEFSLVVGDILVFTVPADYPEDFTPGDIVGHRIVYMLNESGVMMYYTKGDNVAHIDPAPVTNDEVVGEVYKIIDEGSLQAMMIDWFT